MRTTVAKNIGFCSGVKRAVSIAEKSLKKDPKPIWFLGNLVHNEKVLEKFKKRGVKFIAHPKQAKSGTLIIQAHGFPPFPKEIDKKLLIRTSPSARTLNVLHLRDATCPLVKKVQTIANFLYKKGYKVIIVGDKKHSETKGIKGYTKNKAIIIESKNQAKNLPEFEKIGIVSQTTQNLENFKQILKILKNKAKEVKWFNTICPEVMIRQRELNEISKKSDGVLVIGSRSSANTKRLVQIAKNFSKRIFWINSLKELKNEKIKGISSLGVVSGTSTPNWEIEKIKKYLRKAKRNSSSSSPQLS